MDRLDRLTPSDLSTVISGRRIVGVDFRSAAVRGSYFEHNADHTHHPMSCAPIEGEVTGRTWTDHMRPADAAPRWAVGRN